MGARNLLKYRKKRELIRQEHFVRDLVEMI